MFVSLKKVNTSHSTLKKMLLIFNEDFSFYLENYQFLFRNLIELNNIFLQEKAIDNQKLLIQSLKLTPQPLIATIEDFNVKYFELIEKNFIATEPLFKRDYLTAKENYIGNIVNNYKQIWSITNTEIEKIILLLENESTLNMKNDIKKYLLINTTSFLKEIRKQQKNFRRIR